MFGEDAIFKIFLNILMMKTQTKHVKANCVMVSLSMWLTCPLRGTVGVSLTLSLT